MTGGTEHTESSTAPTAGHGPVDRPVGRPVPERADDAAWQTVTAGDAPKTWADASRYRVVCSGGFVGPYGLESALLHKPGRWPQCYPGGADSEACCTLTVQRKTPNGRGNAGPAA